MPPTIETTKPADKIDYSVYVGKTFKTKAETGLNSDRTFKVTEFYPNKDFGSHGGGKKPAFRVERSGGGVHTPRCDVFLKHHEEIKAEG